MHPKSSPTSTPINNASSKIAPGKPNSGAQPKPNTNNRGRKSKFSPHSGLSKKKEKLYCICQTPYDDSK